MGQLEMLADVFLASNPVCKNQLHCRPTCFFFENYEQMNKSIDIGRLGLHGINHLPNNKNKKINTKKKIAITA